MPKNRLATIGSSLLISPSQRFSMTSKMIYLNLAQTLMRGLARNRSSHLAKLTRPSQHWKSADISTNKAAQFGSDQQTLATIKDRVIRRDNGETTYFASDIAYIANKFSRGFDRIIYVWGADHHGYIVRIKAAAQALGFNPERLTVRLVQFAILYKDGERLQMSTRSGSFVTLRELRDDVGRDACRYFYVMRKADQHLDFDLSLATSQSKDNPVYYIQYAHARICRVFEGLEGQPFDEQRGLGHLTSLVTQEELDLATAIGRFPEVVGKAADSLKRT